MLEEASSSEPFVSHQDRLRAFTEEQRARALTELQRAAIRSVLQEMIRDERRTFPIKVVELMQRQALIMGEELVMYGYPTYLTDEKSFRHIIDVTPEEYDAYQAEKVITPENVEDLFGQHD